MRNNSRGVVLPFRPRRAAPEPVSRPPTPLELLAEVVPEPQAVALIVDADLALAAARVRVDACLEAWGKL